MTGAAPADETAGDTADDTAREVTTWTGRRVPAEIGPVGHGGHCVARVDGRVVFVRHALPGEQVLVEITEDHGGAFCRGDAVEIHRPSPDRVAPSCPLARPGGCGGCDWQHADPAAQRALKAAVVAEQFRRLARLDVSVRVEELPGGPLGWRTRLRLAVADDGRAGLRAHRSHRVLPLDDCPIAVPGLLDDALARRWPAGAQLDVVRDDAGHQHLTRLDPPPTRPDTRRRGQPGRRPGRHPGGRTEQHAAGRTFSVRADGFWQVHPAAADTFAAVVAEWAAAPTGGRAWDLYGGAGLFAAVLAEQVGVTGSVLLVEVSPVAVADARANLADLPQVRCVAGRVERVLAGLPDGPDGVPDVVVADPPRTGAGIAVMGMLAAAGPARVVYVGCDPAATARDVGVLLGHGYRLAELRAFDAFPMTHHVECLALLTR